ncbi:MAG TPA: alpha/beta fold hydrolase [Ktedonobacterales bacterium]|nr:alpha/beta fold hydrolase [Ktedonobacterales bacterium]
MNTVTSKDGTTIAFDHVGAGPALILVDGALCYRTFGPMGPLAALLAPHFTVYTYDRRGRGESGDTPPFAVEREIEDIEALINEARGSAGVYGISSGAFLALEAASQLPAKITKLAIYEPPASMDEAAIQRFKEYRTQLDGLIAAGRRGDAVALFMRFVGGGLATDDNPMPDEPGAQMRGTPVWPMFEAVAPTLAYDAAAMGDSSVPTGVAAAVAMSTLAMAGGASPAWMQRAAQAVAAAAPHAQSRILEGQTHEVAAEAIAPVLIEFFSAR